MKTSSRLNGRWESTSVPLLRKARAGVSPTAALDPPEQQPRRPQCGTPRLAQRAPQGQPRQRHLLDRVHRRSTTTAAAKAIERPPATRVAKSSSRAAAVVSPSPPTGVSTRTWVPHERLSSAPSSAMRRRNSAPSAVAYPPVLHQ